MPSTEAIQLIIIPHRPTPTDAEIDRSLAESLALLFKYFLLPEHLSLLANIYFLSLQSKMSKSSLARTKIRSTIYPCLPPSLGESRI